MADTGVDYWLPPFEKGADSSGNFRRMMGAILFLPVLVLLRGATGYATGYLMGWVSENAIKDLKLDIHRKLQTLSLGYFQHREMGGQTMLFNTGVGAVWRCLYCGFSDLVKEPFALLSIFVALLILDWQLTVVGLVFLPLTIGPVIILGRKIRKQSEIAYEKGEDQDSLIVEVYSNIRLIKAYCLERLQQKRFETLYQHLARAGIKRWQAKEIVNPAVEFLAMIGFGVLLAYIFWEGRSIPQLIGFLTGMIMLYQPLKKLAGINIYFQEAVVGANMVRDAMKEEPAVKEDPAALELKEFSEEIKFEGLEFSYEKELVLHEFDLVIPKGLKLGVVGESGAGKSTLVSLLLRFYDPTKGRIAIDGTDIRDVSFESLRKQMALVSQEVVIFDQTVAENIACGNLDASPEEIIDAAKAANAHEFIEGLPEGYDTRLGEQGTRLSGGQRQRIAIARAFVRQASILVLDEATASLDSKAEAEVQAAIDRLEQGRTVLCVAHRLSTLRKMDKIIVLEEGRVVESGSFEELLKKDGAFAEMALKQGLTGGAANSGG
ncbi:MAG: ABC transporter ATP-binding protein [Verrucomicrobiota bacterium]|nr:ABC transporter ATP-binding protein [Verrucomicrobiota bacterium]